VSKAIAGWRELAGHMDCGDRTAAHGSGQTEQLRCGHAGGGTHVILHIV